jgi:hypothetical protein
MPKAKFIEFVPNPPSPGASLKLTRRKKSLPHNLPLELIPLPQASHLPTRKVYKLPALPSRVKIPTPNNTKPRVMEFPSGIRRKASPRRLPSPGPSPSPKRQSTTLSPKRQSTTLSPKRQSTTLSPKRQSTRKVYKLPALPRTIIKKENSTKPKEMIYFKGIQTKPVRRLPSLGPSPSRTRKVKTPSPPKQTVIQFNEKEAIAAIEEMRKTTKGKRLPGELRTQLEAAAYLEQQARSSKATSQNVKEFTETIEGVYKLYEKWKQSK